MAKEIGKQIGRYKIFDIFWLDSVQLIISGDIHTDRNGCEYNIEIQYYSDTNEITYVACYDGGVIIIDTNSPFDNEYLTKEEIDGFNEIITNHKND